MTRLGVADDNGPQRSRGRLALRLDGSCRSAGAVKLSVSGGG